MACAVNFHVMSSPIREFCKLDRLTTALQRLDLAIGQLDRALTKRLERLDNASSPDSAMLAEWSRLEAENARLMEENIKAIQEQGQAQQAASRLSDENATLRQQNIRLSAEAALRQQDLDRLTRDIELARDGERKAQDQTRAVKARLDAAINRLQGVLEEG
jgi:chromosome segregation ATPase